MKIQHKITAAGLTAASIIMMSGGCGSDNAETSTILHNIPKDRITRLENCWLKWAQLLRSIMSAPTCQRLHARLSSQDITYKIRA